MTDNNWNRIAFVAISVAVVLLACFFTALLDSKSGEVAGALGGVIGGAIGALGSAAAVYLMLQGQRVDEIERVSAAVLREIAELCKAPIGQLGACAGIQTGQIRCPSADLKNLFHAPTPVVFPAVAGLIGRLPRPTLVVTFYMQLQETRGIVAVIESNAPAGEIVTGSHIQVLADLLISQCQLARFILSAAEPEPDREVALVARQRSHLLKVLDEQLAAAKQLFPNADSFQDQG